MKLQVDHYMNYFLQQIAKSYNKNNDYTQKYVRIVKNEINSYRASAYFMKPSNTSRICNYVANTIEKQLEESLRTN